MERLQHARFGTEIRALISSKMSEDVALTGILIDELNALMEAKQTGACHPKEDSLSGSLSQIRYLRLYVANRSVRVYFTVNDNTLWMLHLDVNKRRNNLSTSTKKKLSDRLRDVKTNPTYQGESQ